MTLAAKMPIDATLRTPAKAGTLTNAPTARDSALLPRALFVLAVPLAILVAGLAARPTTHVFSTPLTEDSFYSLAVARNLALGLGFTIDGTHPTNGFQPLYTVIEGAAYYLAGNAGSVAIRIIFALSWAIWLGTGLLVGRIAAGLRGADEPPGLAPARRWIATLLYLGGFLTFMHHFNGLETGLVMLLYALLWRAHQADWLARAWGPVAIGGLMGLLVLARIDAAVFVALYVGWRLLSGLRAGRTVASLGEVIVIGGLALLISAPWWWFNYHTFGALMPTSGQAQQALAFDERRWRWVFWALGVDMMPTLWVGRFDELFHDGLIPSVVRALVAAALLAWFARRLRRTGLAGAEARRTRAFGWLLAAAVCALAVYYGASFIAFWFYYRYLFPAALLGCVVIAWTTAPLASRRPWRAAALIALLTAPTVVSALMAYQGRTLHVETVYWDQLDLVGDRVPLSETVAAGQAGTLGYFRKRVIDVDGKVNAEVLPYQAEMWTYLRAHDVRWFADWPFYVEKYLGPDPTAHGWKQVGSLGIWQLWHYEGD